MESRSPELPEVLERLRRKVHAELRVSIPCSVDSYDAAHRCCDCTPLVKEVVFASDGKLASVSLQRLTHVPVVFPGGGGGSVTFPVAKGDTVLVVCSDRSLDNWKSRGVEVDPADARLHDMTVGFAIPGLQSYVGATAADPDNVVVTGPDGSGTVTLKPGGGIDIAAGGTGGTIAIQPSGTVVLNGGLMAIARVGDTAGPYPIIGGNPKVLG